MNVLIEVRHGLEVKVSEKRHYGYENYTLITLAVYIQHKYSHLRKQQLYNDKTRKEVLLLFHLF